MARVGIASGSDDTSSSHSHKPRISIDVETLRLHAAAVTARLASRIRLDTLRPLPVFLGLDPASHVPAKGAFTPPVRTLDKVTTEKLASRLRLNVAFFISNYAALAAVIALVVSLLHPGMLFSVAAVWGLWTLHHFLIKHECVLFGVAVHSVAPIAYRFYVLVAVTVGVVLWKCLKPTLLFLLLAALLIGSHALWRDPKHIEASAADWMDGAAASTMGGGGTAESDEEGGGGSSSSNGSPNNGGSLGVLVERPAGRRSDAI